jgi:ATP-dependent Clp protease protease subunit
MSKDEKKKEKDIKKEVKPISGFELPVVNIDGILSKCQQVFLYEDIDNESALRVCKELVALDAAMRIDEQKKDVYIMLRINSNGGEINAGMSIIDTMGLLGTPVITMVVGAACSMAAIIAICGDRRVMTQNSRMMFHPPAGGVGPDYVQFERDSLDEVEKMSTSLYDIIKTKTKLGQKKNKKILEKCMSGALFMSAKEALKYGVIDDILKGGNCG